MPKLEVEQLLVISTSHVSASTVVLLPRCASDHDENYSPPLWWPRFTRDEGWVFHVPKEPSWFDDWYHGAPDDIRTCVAFARDHGCAWLMLDADGPVIEGLQTHEW